MEKNKQLLSRAIFLVVFGAAIFGIFWLGQVLAKPEDTSSVISVGVFEKGKATLVEYSDFQCPACKMYYSVLKQLSDEFGDNLIWVYKYFPLKAIHKNAELSAWAGESARLQGKFLEMEDILFTKQDEWASSDQALSLFTAYAISLGLDKDKFLKDIESDTVHEKIDNDYTEGVSLKVGGTPTFFLNGKKITNPANYNEFKQLIQNEIK